MRAYGHRVCFQQEESLTVGHDIVLGMWRPEEVASLEDLAGRADRQRRLGRDRDRENPVAGQVPIEQLAAGRPDRLVTLTPGPDAGTAAVPLARGPGRTPRPAAAPLPTRVGTARAGSRAGGGSSSSATRTRRKPGPGPVPARPPPAVPNGSLPLRRVPTPPAPTPPRHREWCARPGLRQTYAAVRGCGSASSPRRRALAGPITTETPSPVYTCFEAV